MKIFKKQKKTHNSKPEKRKFFFNNYEKNSEINVTKTAESLEVSRRTIYNWMQEINS
jgi:transcriptional antiterminator